MWKFQRFSYFSSCVWTIDPLRPDLHPQVWIPPPVGLITCVWIKPWTSSCLESVICPFVTVWFPYVDSFHLKFWDLTDGDSNKSFLALPSVRSWLWVTSAVPRCEKATAVSLPSPRLSAFIYVSDFPPFMSQSLRSVTSEIIFLLNRSICSLSLPLPQPLAAFSTSFFSLKDLSASTHSGAADIL